MSMGFPRSYFTTNLKVLPLGCYDIILGMDWLEDHSPMEMGWANKKMSFLHKGQHVQLERVTPKMEQCQLISGEQLEGLIKSESVEHILELSITYELAQPPKTRIYSSGVCKVV